MPRVRPSLLQAGSVSPTLCLELLGRCGAAVMIPKVPQSNNEHHQQVLPGLRGGGYPFLGHHRGFVEERGGFTAGGNAE